MLAYENSIAYGLLKNFEAYRHEVEQYAAVTDFCPIPVFVTAHDGLAVLYVNPAYIEMTGCDVRTLSDFNWAKIIHPDDRERSVAVWKQFIEDRKPIHIDERYINVNTGQVFDTCCIVRAIPNDGVVGYIFPKNWTPRHGANPSLH